jgi:uncharacterized membrane protein (UPF0136 family)
MFASSRIRRLALVLPLLATVGGCATWSQRSASAQAQDETYAGTVRVTRADGRAIVLDRVTVGADSVVGLDRASPHGRVAIPAAEVRRLESRKPQPVRTAALAAVGAIAAFVAVFAITYHSECSCIQ